VSTDDDAGFVWTIADLPRLSNAVIVGQPLFFKNIDDPAIAKAVIAQDLSETKWIYRESVISEYKPNI
jgi:hypothetical protein